MPLLVVSADRTVATKRNGAQKTTTTATLYSRPTAGDHEIAALVVDVVELAGYPKPAAELRELVEGAGLREVSTGGLVELAAAVTGTALSGRSVTPGVSLAHDQPALDGFRRVLVNLRDAIVLNWDGTIADIDPEFLHDLRVGVRRTRSVLSNASGVIPDDVRDRAREEFGWLGQVTGPARDLDVYQIEWPGYTSPLGPATAAALELGARSSSTGRRRDEHATLATELGGERATRIIDAWSEWLDAPVVGDVPDDAAEPIGELVERRIRRAHKTMIRRGRTIAPDTDAEVLHELRKDAKKLRYLLECFGGLYAAAARKAFVQRLKALQDNLGEHQDAEVHVHHLRELSETLAPTSSTETMLATGQLIERLEQRRLACRSEFAERFAAFDDPEDRRRARRALPVRVVEHRRRPVKVVATYSIKGGVGKTTAAVNLSFEAARSGARVLLWDLDPQGAATFFFRIKLGFKGGAERLVGKQGELAAHVKESDLPGLHLLPADFSLRHLDLRLDEVSHSTHRLKSLLEPLADQYDVAVLDCPPGISLTSEAVFRTADALLVPTIPTTLSVRTLRPARRLPRRESDGDDAPRPCFRSCRCSTGARRSTAICSSSSSTASPASCRRRSRTPAPSNGWGSSVPRWASSPPAPPPPTPSTTSGPRSPNTSGPDRTRDRGRRA